jgi:hypothetical protein
MRLKQNGIHEYLLINSLAHIKQCIWLMPMESNLVKDLLYIHLKFTLPKLEKKITFFPLVYFEVVHNIYACT